MAQRFERRTFHFTLTEALPPADNREAAGFAVRRSHEVESVFGVFTEHLLSALGEKLQVENVSFHVIVDQYTPSMMPSKVSAAAAILSLLIRSAISRRAPGRELRERPRS